MELTARAEALTDDDDARGVLALAIALWRATPRLEIAGLVDALSRVLRDETQSSPDPERMARAAAADDVVAQGSLLASLCDTPVHVLPQRLEALSKWRDPRVAPAVAELLSKPFHLENARREGFETIAAIVAESGDSRVIGQLRIGQREQPSFLGHDEWVKRLEALEAQVASRTEPALDDDAAAALAILTSWWERARRRRRWRLRMSPAERRFWDGLAQAPDDDALRQVLADGLIEAGDARGELLVQVARGDAVADATLAAAWLRDAPEMIAIEDTVFEGGLPRLLRLRGWEPADRAHPLWRMVRELGVTNSDPWTTEAPEVPSFPSLRRVRGLGAAGFARLLEVQPPTGITDLSVVWGPPLPSVVAPARGQGLPSLTRLAVTAYNLDEAGLAPLAALLEGPVGARLRAFSLLGPAEASAWQQLFRRAGAVLDELTIEQRSGELGAWHTRVRLRRVDGAAPSDRDAGLRLTVWIARKGPSVERWWSRAAPLLSSVEPSAVVELDVEAPEPPADEELAELRTVARRFPRLTEARVLDPTWGRTWATIRIAH